MKAILEFDLTDPDDSTEHLRCVMATDAYSALWDIQQEIRKKWKYNEDEKEADYFYKFATDFSDILSNHGIDLD